MTRQKWKEAPVDVGQLRKTWGGVFDNSTILAIRGLLTRGTIKELTSVIKEGKESLILSGVGEAGPIAVKVYAIAAANFKKMQPYLQGDRRFSRVKSDKRSVVYAWANKEYKNLHKAAAAGVACPTPIAVRANVLVMSFLGEGGLPYPRLADSKVEDYQGIFDKVVEGMRLLHQKAGIVHGDLSEFNILLGDRTYIIDFSQSVVIDHPQAEAWLRRDVENVCKYFGKRGVTADVAQVYERVTGKSFEGA
jgi:RIO kinase 1